jgi:hypothetical protein
VPHIPKRSRRFLAVAGATALAVLAFAPSAGAGVLVKSATNCGQPSYERPFLRWLDVASYVLAPDGTLEGATGHWSLAGGAAVTSGNESYNVHGTGETHSLGLPAGSSATTGAMCVGLLHPTLRLFARNRGAPLSALRVEVLFEDAAGAVHSLPISLLVAGSAWQPTLPIPVVANLLPLLPGSLTAVAFRFTPQGPGGAWQIDDAYVDPHRSH